MSFFQRIRELKAKSPIVFVKFPSKNPALEIQFQRLTPSEIAGIEVYALSMVEQDSNDWQRERQFNGIYMIRMIDQLEKNIRGWKGIETDAPEFSKAEAAAFFKALDLDLKSDLKRSYTEAAEATTDFLHPDSKEQSKTD